MIVLDASAALELLLATPTGEAVGRRVLRSEESLLAPHVIDLEVAQVLRRLHSAGIVTDARANEVLEDLGGLGIERYPHAPLLDRIWQLRHVVTAYDAAYVALAEALGAPLITCDLRLAAAVSRLVKVESFPNA